MSAFMEMNMAILRLLAEMRTPTMDAIMMAITRLGEETMFMVIALFVFWCIDKNKGYYLLSIGFSGMMLNQCLKITARIERPWVLDPNFQIVESARAAASGYSFPSGHTQNAVGTMGGIACAARSKVLRVICIILAAAVAFSRLYLGVHTLLDVGVSVIVAILLIFACQPILAFAGEWPRRMMCIWSGMLLIAVLYLYYVLCIVPKHGAVDAANYAAALKNAYSMVGAAMGLFIVYVMDQRWLRFDTRAVWWGQLLKMVFGLGLILAVKAGLKAPLYAACGSSGDIIRYALIVITAGILWPLSFPLFGRLGRKNGRIEKR